MTDQAAHLDAAPRRRKDDALAPHAEDGFCHRFVDLLLRSDTAPTRCFLAIAAALWAIGLLMPGDTMSRPVYRYMGAFAGETFWFWCWASYSGLMVWRVFTARGGRIIPLSINVFGLCLWGFCSVSMMMTMTYPYPAGIAPDFACLLAALWVFARTHILPFGGWRGD